MVFVANSSALFVLVQKCVVNELKLVEIGFVVINYTTMLFVFWGFGGQ